MAVGSAAAKPRADAYCQSDSKLLGRYELSTEDKQGTWWQLTRDGFVAAGIDSGKYMATIEGFFGTTFSDLDEAVQALVDAVKPLDKNGNNYVCANSLRGTRAYLDDPNFVFYFFSVIDDKLGKG